MAETTSHTPSYDRGVDGAPRFKICGLTGLDDARLAVEVGAWALGVILWEGSERRCEPAEAQRIARTLRRQAEVCGVFVNAPLDEVAGLADGIGLTMVQLHGDEGPAYCAEVARRTGAKVMKAVRVRTGADVEDLARFHTDFHLLDTFHPERWGGTGESFDWTLAARRRTAVPLVLSGGLTPGERRRGDRRGPAVRRRRGQRHRGVPRGQGSRAPARVRRGRAVDGGGAGGVSGNRTPPGPVSLEHRYGPYGGQYVPETLMPALGELEAAWLAARRDPAYGEELARLLTDYAGRPTPLYLAERLSEAAGREVWLKREDLMHTGSHKLNNALGQALLARRMGKARIIAETGAGQHGVASATACALLDLECIVYMGGEDIRRQQPNVQRMELLGARVVAVEAGARTLKEAVSEAIRDWVTNVATTHYIIGSAVGPAPYPAIVRDLQRVIGDEARAQLLERAGRLPDRVIACVGGGSNAIGTFAGFVDDAGVALVGVEAAGEGLDTGRHGAPLTVGGRPGVLHGSLSAIMQDDDGQITEAHSVSAGLDYPGSGPEHAWLRDSGRARYVAVDDEQALAAFRRVARLEGIIPALETAHALHFALRAGSEHARPGVPVRPRRQGPRGGPGARRRVAS